MLISRCLNLSEQYSAYRFITLSVGLTFSILLLLIANLWAADQIVQIEIPSTPNPVGSGARALGMGGAFISIADDATAASWNPGGLIQLEKPEISIVLNYIERKEKNRFGLWPEASGNQSINTKNINYFSASYPFNFSNINMIASVSYQHMYDFNRDWTFKYDTDLPNYHATTSMDYKQKGDLYAIGFSHCTQITPYFSFGFTINYWGDFLFENKWEQTYGQTLDSSVHGHTELCKYDKYDLSGINANLGFMWWLNNKFRVSGVLKTPFEADVDHLVKMTSITTYSTSPQSNHQTDSFIERKDKLHMPLQYGIGSAYKFSDRFEASFDLYRTHWENYKYEDEKGNMSSPISGNNINDADINPTIWCRLGCEYLLIKNDYVIPLRTGIFSDPNPSEKGKDNIYGFSLGTGLIFKKFVLDVAYQYRFGNDVGDSFLKHINFSQDIEEHKVYSSIIMYL